MAPHRGSLMIIDTPSTVRLLEADPDIGRYLTPDERREAAALTVPSVELPPGPVGTSALLARHGSFGAFVLEGMLACHLRVGEQASMRILGPGDIVSAGPAPMSLLLAERGCRAVIPTRVAMLGRDVLVGAHRWPRLLAGLHVRTVEQIERVAVQLAICHLPRVEERLLALFWLLAESWGRVTPSGTVLPLALTHETLGALVGARRPTVTLALRELSERGAVLRQGHAWLLTEMPPQPSRVGPEPHAPGILPAERARWGVRELPAPTHRDIHDEIMSTVQRLHAQHETNAEAIRSGLERVRAARIRSQQLRERVRRERRVRTPSAPSSG
jgi:CRP/FNR family cyclic AMP-dependent transcriptional regulator